MGCLEGHPADAAPGELQSVDGYMNIALEKTAEYVNGAKRRDYGDAFVRGNNGELEETRDGMIFANSNRSYVHLSRLMNCNNE